MHRTGGVRGRVVSRAGRVALDGVKVTMTPGDVTVMSDERGNFLIENVPAGEYSLQFETPEFEPLSIAVRVGSQVRDINAVVLVPDVPRQMIDDAVFAEFDMETGRRCAGIAYVALGLQGHLQQHRFLQVQRDALQRPRL